MSSNAVSMKPVVDEAVKVSEPELKKEHEVGEIIGSSENVEVETTITEKVINQKMPKTELGKFMQRPVRIAALTLASTDTPLSALTSYTPWTLFFTNTAVAHKTRDFAYFRGGLRVQLITTVPAGCYGSYLVAACPYGDTPTTGVSVADPNVYQAAQLPHALVDLSRADDVTLHLDWCYPYDWGSLTDVQVQKQWKIFIYCLQPIGNGSGATALTADISVYAWADEEFDMVVPYQQGKKMLEDKRNQINEKIKGFTGGKKASEIASKAGEIAGKIGSYVPFLAPMAGTFATGAAMASTALDWFGFTRETGEKEPTPVVFRPFSNIANMDGIDTGEVAALSVSNSISIDPRLGGGNPIDEASLDEIFSHWTLINRTVWTEAMNPGDAIITALPVTPFTAANSPFTGAVMTTAGYCGLPFQYWRGDMEYKIVIPVSKFHRGAVQITWVPAPVISGDLSNVTLNSIIEIDSDSSCFVTVGFSKDQPMLSSRFMNVTYPTIVPIGLANGMLRISVVNRLTAPAVAADTSVLVFARALPGMDFGCPKVYDIISNTTNTAQVPMEFFQAYSLQGGALGDDPEEECRITLVEPSGVYPSAEVCLGEQVRSVRALMQKFSQVRSMSEGSSLLGSQYGYYLAHFGFIPMEISFATSTVPNMVSSSHEFTWMGWYQPLFVGIAGSVRYKVVNAAGAYDSTSSIPSSQIVVGGMAWPQHDGISFLPLTQTGISSVCPAWPLKPGEAHECTIPYYHHRQFDCAYNNPLITAAGVNTVQTRVDYLWMGPINKNIATTETNTVTYRAAGPDLRLIRFRYTPVVIDDYASISVYPMYGGQPS